MAGGSQVRTRKTPVSGCRARSAMRQRCGHVPKDGRAANACGPGTVPNLAPGDVSSNLSIELQVRERRSGMRGGEFPARDKDVTDRRWMRNEERAERLRNPRFGQCIAALLTGSALSGHNPGLQRKSYTAKLPGAGFDVTGSALIDPTTHILLSPKPPPINLDNQPVGQLQWRSLFDGSVVHITVLAEKMPHEIRGSGNPTPKTERTARALCTPSSPAKPHAKKTWGVSASTSRGRPNLPRPQIGARRQYKPLTPRLVFEDKFFKLRSIMMERCYQVPASSIKPHAAQTQGYQFSGSSFCRFQAPRASTNFKRWSSYLVLLSEAPASLKPQVSSIHAGAASIAITDSMAMDLVITINDNPGLFG
ncbi:hypothetical protein B0H17DRAFT_1126637 [Mycena rosella]|uniref:Uncharacterized protein n=1 Tax=Mycena rosella TaxID=1033263 RepID=A0AAD7GTS7_MYCRO|nr:hypothetical protein B0H17DRAFT_1126637 [Mycena rosella]